jgi:hypothetical protein
VIGVIGPEDQIRERPIAAIPGVESATPVLKPYKLVAREFRGGNVGEVKVGDVAIGGGEVVLMSGPCSVENREQIVSIAKAIKSAGAKVLEAAPSNRGLPHTPFKGSAKKVCVCSPRRAQHRAAGHHRNHGHEAPRNHPRQYADCLRSVRATCRTPQGSRPLEASGNAQTRHERDDQRPPDERRIHSQRGQFQRAAL